MAWKSPALSQPGRHGCSSLSQAILGILGSCAPERQPAGSALGSARRLTMAQPEPCADVPVGGQVGQRGVELHATDAGVDVAVPQRPALRRTGRVGRLDPSQEETGVAWKGMVDLSVWNRVATTTWVALLAANKGPGGHALSASW